MERGVFRDMFVGMLWAVWGEIGGWFQLPLKWHAANEDGFGFDVVGVVESRFGG